MLSVESASQTSSREIVINSEFNNNNKAINNHNKKICSENPLDLMKMGGSESSTLSPNILLSSSNNCNTSINSSPTTRNLCTKNSEHQH